MHTPSLRYCSLLLVLIPFLYSTPARAQLSAGDPLFRIIKTKDSLLFNAGFNNCNIAVFEKLVSDSFEFYHDQAGIMPTKAEFINSVRNNVCGAGHKARRALDEGTMEVYTLMKRGKLYGAIENGRHRFYALETGKPEYFTSRARFTNLWVQEQGEWKLRSSLSYDHKEAETDTPPIPPLDDSLQMMAWLNSYKVPGLALGLIHNSKLEAIKVYGELDKGRPMPYNAIFNVASITKTVTTMTALRLASSGKWDLDEPLYHYWTDPDVQDDPRSKQLTTRHILNQESGFPNWRRELKGGKLAFQFAPGTQFQYSGEGFEYLRHALERKFHRSLEELGAEQIFRPLDMKDTHYTWDKRRDTARIAIPHNADGKALAIDRNAEPNGADLLTTTITDLSKFLLAAGSGEGLSESIAEQMVAHATKTKADRYVGLGWFIYDIGNGAYAISHGGDDKGIHSICFLLPKTGDGIIIFTNSDNGPRYIYADIIRAYLKEKGQAIIDIELK